MRNLATGVLTLELFQFINRDVAVYHVALAAGTALFRGGSLSQMSPIFLGHLPAKKQPLKAGA